MTMAADRLLIVEDEPAMLSILRDILEGEGYEVYPAADGIEALDILKDHPIPDLIISDVMMPRMDGFELLRRVRRVEAWVNIPFMFLTARSEPSDMVSGMTLGADDYIPKPFEYAELVKVVAARLDRYRALARRQSTQMDELKRQILMLLNHEFRTPLTLIVAYTNMLKDFDEQQISREDLIGFLQNVTDGAQRLRRLVENFILLADLNWSSQSDTDFAWRMHRITDPAKLLRDALESVSRPTDEHTFTFQIAPKLPAFSGDTESLIIALRELIDNAIKSSPQQSSIVISAMFVDGAVQLSVTDHGHGIPADHLQQLGEAFYQVERSKLETQGAGTGLAIANAIARLHNGHIAVESIPNDMTTISLVLPIG